MIMVRCPVCGMKRWIHPEAKDLEERALLFPRTWRLTVKCEGCGKSYRIWYTEEDDGETDANNRV